MQWKISSRVVSYAILSYSAFFCRSKSLFMLTMEMRGKWGEMRGNSHIKISGMLYRVLLWARACGVDVSFHEKTTDETLLVLLPVKERSCSKFRFLSSHNCRDIIISTFQARVSQHMLLCLVSLYQYLSPQKTESTILLRSFRNGFDIHCRSQLGHRHRSPAPR